MKGVVNVYEEGRNKDILDLYCEGNTCARLSVVFGISRARVHQLIIKQMQRDILKKLNLSLSDMSNEEIVLLDLAAKQEVREIYLSNIANKLQTNKKTIIEAAKNLPDYSNFRNVGQYAAALGVSVQVFKKILPDIYQKIKNKTVHKWSRYYESCRNCKTTLIKHRSNGLCSRCYYKSNEFKDICRDSRIKSRNKREIERVSAKIVND